MKFLLDENISPNLIKMLEKVGFEARHIVQLGLSSIADISIFEMAESTNEIIITHDLDFSTIHALSGKSKPSVIQFRIQKLTAQIIMDILSDIIEQFKSDFEKGILVTVDKNGIRVRELPIIRKV